MLGWQAYQLICKHRWYKPYANEKIEKCVLCNKVKDEDENLNINK